MLHGTMQHRLTVHWTFVSIALRRRVAMSIATAVACSTACGGGANSPATSPTPTAAVATTATTTAAPGSAWVNPTYTPDRVTLASLAIAPLPFASGHAAQLDEALERVFLDTPGSQLRGQPAAIRQAMNGNRPFLQQIERMRTASYTPAELPAANLHQLFDARELIALREALRSSTMLVLPTEFVITAGQSTTDGHVAYRVYHLADGRLLLQNRFQTRVAEGGQPGEREATIQLILAVQKDFADRLMP